MVGFLFFNPLQGTLLLGPAPCAELALDSVSGADDHIPVTVLLGQKFTVTVLVNVIEVDRGTVGR